MRKDNEQKTNRSWYQSKALMIGICAIAILAVIGTFAMIKNNLGSVDKPSEARIQQSGDSQEISMLVAGAAYQPSVLTVNAGKSVKWLVDGTKAVGCTRYLMSPQLGINKKLEPGINTIEFTAPTKPGSYGFSCSMGMVKGTMNVV